MGVGGPTSGERLLVGLAVGDGTGPELARVFEASLFTLADAAGAGVRIERSPHLYRTFGGVLAAGLSAAEVERSSHEDAAEYERFLRELSARGGSVVFRLAFNAQPLYAVRERLDCVKVELLPHPGGELILIRDQAQGFYAGENDADGSPDEIRRTCSFSRGTTTRILDFALELAERRWRGSPHGPVVKMAYKFHVLDRRFADWVDDYSRQRGVRVSVFQPDTMNRHLLRGSFRGNLVIVAGNEWGDIMHADLLARAGLGNQEERCSKNVFLAPELRGLTEYQTVHGSADDIAGAGTVNPVATLRAAARILEEHAGAIGVVAAVEAGLASAAAAAVATPDAGGEHGTEAVAEHVVAEAVAALGRRRLAAAAASS